MCNNNTQKIILAERQTKFDHFDFMQIVIGYICSSENQKFYTHNQVKSVMRINQKETIEKTSNYFKISISFN